MNEKNTPGIHDSLLLNLEAIQKRILNLEKVLVEKLPYFFKMSSDGIKVNDNPEPSPHFRMDEETGRLVARTLYQDELDELKNQEKVS